MKKLLFLLAILLPAAASAHHNPTDTVPSGDTPYMRAVERADSAIAGQDWERALHLLDSAMHLEPSNPSNVLLLSNAGMLHYYLGQDSAALAALNAAHAMAPASVTVLTNRARVLNALGDNTHAFADYQLVTQLDSTLFEPWLQLGFLQLRGGDFKGAEASIAKAEELEPDNVQVILTRALYLESNGRPGEAIPYYTRLIRNEPSPELYAARAICNIRTDDLGEAADDISKGLELAPADPDLLVARSLLNRRRYREKDAEADARAAVEAGADPLRVKVITGY
ncbi:MAG: tetratricopeptide repeat protein [Muribaculaceae bacterium]|nr:tetratricopeptide repeat protein [Muribaculaceae bacterium]MDE6645162.1 tetratricopeptide repeat protein [Muribaculaceae bacterium]